MNDQFENDNTSQLNPIFDIFAGKTNAEATLAEMATVRQTLSIEELGTLAGRGVMDQYFEAKTRLGNLKTTTSLIPANLSNLPILVLIPGLAIAALAIDYTIFGHAAKDMPLVHGMVNGFAIGAFVFAGLLALTKENHSKTAKGLMYAAALGASFLVAETSPVKDNFYDSIKGATTTAADAPQAALETEQKELARLQKTLDDNKKTLQTGGNNGLTLRGDGNGANDVTADELEADNKDLKTKIAAQTRLVSDKSSTAEIEERKDWANLLARLLAAGYFGVWLIAAQLGLVEVVRRAPGITKEAKEKAVERDKYRTFVNGLEHVDTEKGLAIANAAAGDMLTRFARITAVAAGNNSEKMENFTRIFEGENFVRMQKIATEHIYNTITPNRGPLGNVFSLFARKPSQDRIDDSQPHHDTTMDGASHSSHQEQPRPAR